MSRVALSLYSIAGSENVFRYLGLSVGELRCGFSQTSQPPPSPTTITNHTSTSTTTHVQPIKKKKNIYIKNKTHLSLIASPARWVLLLYHFYNFSCLLSFVYTCLSICTSMNRVYCVMMLTRIECFLVTKSSNCVSVIILWYGDFILWTLKMENLLIFFISIFMLYDWVTQRKNF